MCNEWVNTDSMRCFSQLGFLRGIVSYAWLTLSSRFQQGKEMGGGKEVLKLFYTFYRGF